MEIQFIIGYFSPILLILNLSCWREGRRWLEKRDTVLADNFCRVGEVEPALDRDAEKREMNILL